MWQISARFRWDRLRLLFEAKVSKTISTVLFSLAGCCSALWLTRRSSPLFATCRSIQHALRLCVGVVSGELWSLRGPLSHSSNMVPRPGAGFGFLGIELVDLREFGRLVRTKVLVRDVLSQNSVWVFQALSIAQYFCTMVAKSTKCTMSRRLIALRIPLFVQFLQKSETTSSSRQSLTLFSTRRNLAQ